MHLDPGHVFITRGDLTSLECDAWLVPTDWSFSLTQSWRSHIADPIPTPPHEWDSGELRVLAASPSQAGAPVPFLVNVGAADGVPADWFVDGARAFVTAAAEALAGQAPRNRRARHLVALPVVGTGAGGAADEKGAVTERLVAGLAELATASGLDIALVTFTDHAFAAAQEARRRLQRNGTLEPWSGMQDASVELARQLGADARRGQLVLFLGAGIAAAAGLPLWDELLESLATTAGIDPSSLRKLVDPLDRARLVQGRLAARGTAIGNAIADHLAPFTRCGLVHTLTAALPVNEAATTNYDTLFECARAAIGRPVAALPYAPAADAGWLLKMHGSVDHPDDIVLTRDDYLGYAERRAALKGIVQALLITRRMVFLGFSLTDPNFHRIVHDVRLAVRRGGEKANPFATAIMLTEDAVLSELWRDDLDVHGLGGATIAEAARRLEIFLDLVLAEASPNATHLLNPDYDGILSDAERSLRDALTALDAARDTPAAAASAWTEVDELLRRLGRPESKGR